MKRPVANAGPEKIGIQPSVATIHDEIVAFRTGPRMKTPHRPMTTLGIAARSSTTNVSGTPTRRGAYSARKIAVSRPIGVANSSAIPADRIVPAMNGQRAVDRRHGVPRGPRDERQAERLPDEERVREEQREDRDERQDDDARDERGRPREEPVGESGPRAAPEPGRVGESGHPIDPSSCSCLIGMRVVHAPVAECDRPGAPVVGRGRRVGGRCGRSRSARQGQIGEPPDVIVWSEASAFSWTGAGSGA